MFRSGASLAAVVIAFGLMPSAPANAWANTSDTDTSCGLVTAVGQFNCAHVAINRTSGYCTIYNKGYASERMDCTQSTYSASGNVLGWLNAGSYDIEVRGSYPGGYCAPYYGHSDSKSWGFPAAPESSGPFTITCPAFSVAFGQCGGNAGAWVKLTSYGQFAPRQLRADAGVNNLNDGCIPSGW